MPIPTKIQRIKVGHDVDSVVRSVAGVPLLWYEADKISGATNGLGIGTWVNAGTYGATGDVTQATAGKKPVYTTNSQNGHPGLTFTNAGLSEFRSGAVSIQPRTAIMVAKSSSSDSIFDADNASYSVIYGWTGANANVSAYGGSPASFTGSAGNLTGGVAAVISVSWNGASSFIKQSGVKTTGNFAGITNNRFGIGSAIYRGGSTSWDGVLYALLMWNTVLTETQVNQIEAAYSAKYGLTAYTLT